MAGWVAREAGWYMLTRPCGGMGHPSAVAIHATEDPYVVWRAQRAGMYDEPIFFKIGDSFDEAFAKQENRA